MIGFFTKYGKLLLEILIVLGIVSVIVWINPANIFGGGIKLRTTANNLSSVKNIGQLVTAEYYGETIATYAHAKLKLVNDDDVNDKANMLFQEIKQDLLNTHLKTLKENYTVKELSDEKGGLFAMKFKWLPWVSSPKKEFKKAIRDSTKTSVVASIDSSYLRNPLSVEVLSFYFDKKMPAKGVNSNQFKDMLWALLQEIKAKSMEANEQAFNDYMQEKLPAKKGAIFGDFHYALKRKDADIGKKELAIVGRGCVKAGFDFGEFNEDNFIFDREKQSIHIIGVYPKILDKDINPWFIPQKKIPGFQIILSNKVNFHDAQLVKSYCIDKLERMAKEAGILEQAEKQGVETIKQFFGLLTDTEIKHVYFHNDSLTQQIETIIADDFISLEEAKELDTLIDHQIREIVTLGTTAKDAKNKKQLMENKKQRLKKYIQQLKQCHYLNHTKYYHRLAYMTTCLQEDSILLRSELQHIKNEKWATLLNGTTDSLTSIAQQVWYEDSNSLGYVVDFNEMLRNITHIHYLCDSMTVDSLPTTKGKKAFRENGNQYLFATSYDSFNRFYVLHACASKEETKQEIQQLAYPLTVPKNWKKIWHLEKASLINGIQDTTEVNVKPLYKKITAVADNKLDSTKSLQLSRDIHTHDWKILPPSSLTGEKKLILEKVLSYHLDTHSGFSFFSRNSSKAKKFLGF